MHTIQHLQYGGLQNPVPHIVVFIVHDAGVMAKSKERINLESRSGESVIVATAERCLISG